MDSGVLDRIEVQRLSLEENIANLRKSLRHWQNLELDYEGLKEEIELLPEDTSTDECLRVAKEFNAIVVDEKDLRSLTTDSKDGTRAPRQICDLLSKRVEYVSKNSDTLRNQIGVEERKLNVLLLAQDPSTRDDAALPLSEITEELDESGNIISSKVERPGADAAGLVGALEKAGVDGLKAEDGKLSVTQEPSSAKATVASSTVSSIASPVRDENYSSHGEPVGDSRTGQENLPFRIPVPGENPIPVHVRDTEEEARIRREMLEYGLDEVGAIVAELDLKEGESDVSFDEDDDNLIIDSDFDDDDEEDASEDEFGRVKNPIISEKYRQKMEELEKKLGLTDLKNLGPSPSLPAVVQQALDRPPAAEAARKAAITRANASSKDVDLRPREKKTKKNVAFAEGLDIAKEVPAKRKAENVPSSATNPVGDTVIDRSISHQDDDITAAAPAPRVSSSSKPSRFKAARQSTQASTPHSAKDTTISPSLSSDIRQASQNSIPAKSSSEQPLIASRVLERPTASKSEPPNPDDLDEEMHRREIALEYHKMRNRKIHAQGGFVHDHDSDDEEMNELLSNNMMMDEETGEVKKVSRFKAARLIR